MPQRSPASDVSEVLDAADARVEGVSSDLPLPQAATAPPARIVEIDALRGVAAASVVLWHSFLIFPSAWSDTRSQGVTARNVMKYSPLHGVWAGPQAVLLFFVISGFVLALPFFGPRRPRYDRFLVRRVTRIWPAYAAACAGAFITAAAVGHRVTTGLSTWLNGVGTTPITAKVVGQHLLLIDDFHSGTFDPALWSLVHEMRVSLIFPILLLLTVSLPLWLVVPVVMLGLHAEIQHVSPAYVETWAMTPRYIPYFVAGILIARHRHRLIELARASPAFVRVAFALGSLFLYTYAWCIPGAKLESFWTHVAEVAGTSGLLLVALTSRRLGAVLRLRSLQFLGRISYSLYLVHAIVVVALVRLLYRELPTELLLPLIWIVAIALASLGEVYVERPGIAAGRWLTSRRHGIRAPTVGVAD